MVCRLTSVLFENTSWALAYATSCIQKTRALRTGIQSGERIPWRVPRAQDVVSKGATSKKSADGPTVKNAVGRPHWDFLKNNAQ